LADDASADRTELLAATTELLAETLGPRNGRYLI